MLARPEPTAGAHYRVRESGVVVRFLQFNPVLPEECVVLHAELNTMMVVRFAELEPFSWAVMPAKEQEYVAPAREREPVVLEKVCPPRVCVCLSPPFIALTRDKRWWIVGPTIASS
jgi:hypothetical protein